MAKKRDVIIAIVIVVTFFVTIGFFGLIFVGMYYGDNEVSLGGFGDRIAVVEVFGGIYDSEPIVRQLKKWGNSNSVSAIVLHVDSPGGGVAPSQEIYDEILRVREEDGKYVIVSMSSVAASGGYLISCAADEIMANPGTITGSIGVIMQFMTAGKLLNKIGVDYERVQAGKLKAVGAFDRSMMPEERAMLQSMVKDAYEQFIDVVAEGRKLDRTEVYSIADGSVYTGRQAMELGLVDTLGSFEDAIRMAADMAGISGKPRVVKETRPQKGLWDFMGSLFGEVHEVASGNMAGPRVLYLY
jgi:protease IV